MTSKPVRVPDHLQAWITARKRHHLSHAHVQMARELGMNPNRLGKLDNADQETWKLPLPVFIESLYRKHFGKDRPDVGYSIEERARLLAEKSSSLGSKAFAAGRLAPDLMGILPIWSRISRLGGPR